MKEKLLLKRTLRAAAEGLTPLFIPLALSAQTPLLPAVARGAEEGAPLLTLERAQALARQNNPQLKAARASVQLPEAELAQAHRFSNPILGFGVLPGLNAGTGMSISLGKRFEIGGQRGLRAEASGARLAAAKWEAADVERMLRIQLAQAFYAVRVGEELLQFVDSVVAVTSRLLEAAELKFQAGLAPELDRNIARIQLLQAQVERAQVFGELTVQKAEVNALTGRPPGSDFTAAGPLVYGPVSRRLTVSELQRYALEFRADAQAAAGRGRAALAGVRLARGRALPDVVLGLGLNREADGLRTIGLSAGIAVPLFDRNQFGRDLAGAEREIVVAQAEATSLAISREVRSAFARLETARVQLSTYKEDILALADSSQDFAAMAYARGELDITTAVLAQRQHTNAHVGYLEAVLAFNRAAVELEGAVGAPLADLNPAGREEKDS